MGLPKGRTNNPNGRPPVKNSISDILREALEQVGPDGKSHKQAIADRLIDIGRNGEDKDAVGAVKYIFDRLDGSPKQTIDAEVTDKRPVSFDPELEGTTDITGIK